MQQLHGFFVTAKLLVIFLAQKYLQYQLASQTCLWHSFCYFCGKVSWIPTALQQMYHHWHTTRITNNTELLTLTSMVLTNMLSGSSKCRLLLCEYLKCRQVHIVCHIHVAQIATAAAEACVVAYVGMIQRWPSNTSLLRYTVFVVWVVPTPCTITNQYMLKYVKNVLIQTKAFSFLSWHTP